MPVERVLVRGVRGIREPVALVVDGKSLLLHGPNGSGKSSFERALRWALLGDDEPTAEEPFTTESSFRRHVSVEPDYPLVEVRFESGAKITVSRGAVEFEAEAEGIRAACQRGAPFLRRRELLDVLSARPVDRFRYFETFLGLEPVDGVIRKVAEWRTNLERRLNGVRTNLDRQVGALRPLLSQERQARATDLASLETEAIAAAVELGVSATGADWTQAYANVMALAAEQSADDLAARRVQLLECATALAEVHGSLADPPPDPRAVETRRRELEAATALTGQLDLIRHALQHFVTTEGTECPVCGQEVDWSLTRASLAARAESLASYAESVHQRDDAVRRWMAVWRDFRAAQARLAALVGEEVAGLASLAPLAEGIVHMDQQEDRTAEREVALLAVGGETLSLYLNAAASRAHERAVAAAAQVPAAARLPGLRLTVSLFERLQAGREDLHALMAERQVLLGQLESSRVVYEALRRARQDVARDTLAAIAERVGQYYGEIHPPEAPEESTGAPEIVVQRHADGTAFVRGAFAERQVRDPQWVYSDGHLDTVGICIFLALRRFRADQPGDPKMLVLDDIIVSIDLGHARRLIGLLKDRFGDHQIFLFTHNGLFAHWCASLIPGLRRLEIKSWTLEGGPSLGEYVQAKERLTASLVESSAKEIGLHLMWLMDEWLAEARYAYAVSVPAKPDEQYTLTDIWLPFAKVIRRLARDMESDLGGAATAVERLSDLPSIRNALPAHDNEFAREFPRNVMVEVANLSVSLVDGLYCQQCRDFARPIPNREHPEVVTCRCRLIRYVRPS